MILNKKDFLTKKLNSLKKKKKLKDAMNENARARINVYGRNEICYKSLLTFYSANSASRFNARREYRHVHGSQCDTTKIFS